MLKSLLKKEAKKIEVSSEEISIICFHILLGILFFWFKCTNLYILGNMTIRPTYHACRFQCVTFCFCCNLSYEDILISLPFILINLCFICVIVHSHTLLLLRILCGFIQICFCSIFLSLCASLPYCKWQRHRGHICSGTDTLLHWIFLMG